ncbi:hypothetical protein BDR03DRAFT_141543 [Suillus americanus]|nr:hypothetical protein BDR03DRAFT_141543 [Suillus americanus]
MKQGLLSCGPIRVRNSIHNSKIQRCDLRGSRAEALSLTYFSAFPYRPQRLTGLLSHLLIFLPSFQTPRYRYVYDMLNTGRFYNPILNPFFAR